MLHTVALAECAICISTGIRTAGLRETHNHAGARPPSPNQLTTGPFGECSQLEAAKANGRITRDTVVVAVPDPDGARIGSGGGTLEALRGLDRHLKVLRWLLGSKCD